MPSDVSTEQPVITKDVLAALAKILLPKIEEVAASGALLRAPYYGHIFRSWKYAGNVGEAKAWIERNIDTSAEFLSRVTQNFVRYSIGKAERVYSMDERPDPDLYDLNVLLAACRKHLAGKELSNDARNRVSVVAAAIQELVATPKENP